MRLVDFLIQILEAQGQTLQRLAALLGEEVLLHILEEIGEEKGEEKMVKPSPRIKIQETRFRNSGGPTNGHAAYAELESAVHEIRLSPMLEFHLWAYPLYRAYIESPLELTATASEDGPALVEETLSYARAWVENLGLPSPIDQQIQRAAEIPWLRFRTQILKRIGKRPLGPVY